jgi:hypothetical protein
MKMPSYLLTCAALAVLSQAVVAQTLQSQIVIPEEAYRKNQPMVLTPAPRVVVAAPMAIPEAPLFSQAQFSLAYAKAGKPTMVVLWNRELTDMLEQTSRPSVSIDSSYNRQYSPGQVSGQANTTISAGPIRTQEMQQRDNPEERINLQLRSSFLQTLSAAGVRLVDRNLVMRKTATADKAAAAKAAAKDKSKDKAGPSPLDNQTVEMEAFGKHAKMLMEVLNTPDRASPSGWSTYVSIKSLADGVILMEGYSSGKPPPPLPAAPVSTEPLKPIRYEADPRGGYRPVYETPPAVIAPKALTVQDLGKRIGEETLGKMTSALANR